MRNNVFAGILGLITFIFTINSFFIDATSTAQNLAWIYRWSRTSGIGEGLINLLTNVRLFFYGYGFYFVLAIVAFIIYRRD